MTNMMLLGSMSATGTPLEATLVTIGGSSVAMLGGLAVAAAGVLLLANVVGRLRRSSRRRLAVRMTTGWAGASA